MVSSPGRPSAKLRPPESVRARSSQSRVTAGLPPAEADGSIKRTVFPDSSAPTDCRFRGGARIIGVHGSSTKAAGPELGITAASRDSPLSTPAFQRAWCRARIKRGGIVFLAGDVPRIAESSSDSNRSGAIIRNGVPAGNQPVAWAAGTWTRMISGGAAPTAGKRADRAKKIAPQSLPAAPHWTRTTATPLFITILF